MLKWLTQKIKDGEETGITFMSTVVPWIVPLIPAYMTYSHAINPKELAFPWPIALCAGISVEALGLTSMYRTFQFLEHNRKYSDSKKKSPWAIPALMYVLYLVDVLSINVVQDIAIGEPTNRVWVVAMLSLLSIPAGVLIAVTAVHNERVSEHQKVLTEQRENRAKNRENRKAVPEPVLRTGGGSENGSDGSGEPASRFREPIWRFLEQVWELEHRIPGTTEIVDALNQAGAKLDKHKSKSYIWGQTNEWKIARGLTQKEKIQ